MAVVSTNAEEDKSPVLDSTEEASATESIRALLSLIQKASVLRPIVCVD
jgi:hypothetical protein